jgi:hypothetical protein
MNTIVAIVLIVILNIALIFAIATACNIANSSAKINMELVKVKTMLKTAYAVSDDTTKDILDKIDE